MSSPPGRPSLWREALPLAVAGSAVFLSLYCFTNWLTSLRSNVGTWQFAWEDRIPFVPWMMWPYLSEDVLFVLAFFVCTSRSEVWTHFKRIVAANAIAAICFLLFPLRMAPTRPDHVDGPLRPLVWLQYTLDRPYNLVPSLHIAQGVLVWAVFARHTRPPMRWLVHGWFLLICVSTLFTCQHRLVDVITGLMLGALCWWMIRDPGVDRPAD